MRLWWERQKVGVKNAIIAGLFLLIATITAGIFSLWKSSGSTTLTTKTTTAAKSTIVDSSTGATVASVSPEIRGGSNQILSGNSGTTVIVQGQSGAITIMAGSADSDTSKAIKALENRVSDTDCKIELTHGEVELLANALKELDSRTAGMEKLPDGRTKYSSVVGGSSIEVQRGITETLNLYNSGDYSNALSRIQRAIKLYEETEGAIKDAFIKSGPTKDVTASLYRIAALTCIALAPEHYNLAYDYAKKSLATEQSGQNLFTSAVASYNLGKYDEATNQVAQAIGIDKSAQYQYEVQRIMMGRTASAIRTIQHLELKD